MYSEITIKNETYKLRLNTRASVSLEKALGRSPLTVLMEMDNGEMPKLQDMLIIFHSCLQSMNHNMNLDKVYDLFDDYVDEGHTIFDLVPIFIEVFQESGYLNKPSEKGEAGETEEPEAKN